MDDSFLFHTFFEEYIASDIGSNAFKNIAKFKQHAPQTYTILLNDSTECIEQLEQFYVDIFNVKISACNDYDIGEFIHYVIPPKTPFLNVRHNFIGQNSEKTPYETLIHCIHTFGIRQGECEKCYNITKSSKYVQSNIVIDNDIEEYINGKLNAVVDKILSESTTKAIYVPLGYSTIADVTGHCIGMIVSPSHIIIFNGGEGIEQYHHIDATEPHYPQCCVAMSRLSDVKRMANFIKNMIIINRPYDNTSVNTVYREIFSIYYHNHFVEKYEDVRRVVINFVAQQIREHIAKNKFNIITNTPIIQQTVPNFKHAHKPLLKHKYLYEVVEYVPQISHYVTYNIKTSIFKNTKIVNPKTWKDLLDPILHIPTYITNARQMKNYLSAHIIQSIIDEYVNYDNFDINNISKNICDYVVDFILESYIHHIVGICNNVLPNGHAEIDFLNDVIFSGKYIVNTEIDTLFDFSIRFPRYDSGQIMYLGDANALLNELNEYELNDHKLKSIFDDVGFVREQYSGSCGYNSTLLAMFFHTNNYVKNCRETIVHLKQTIGHNVLLAVLDALRGGTIIISNADKKYINLLEFIFEQTNNIQDAQILNFIKDYLPKYEFPNILIESEAEYHISSKQTSDVVHDIKFTNIHDIIQFIKDDNSIMRKNRMNAIIEIMRTQKAENMKHLDELKSVIKPTYSDDPNKILTLMYLLLFYIDEKVFPNYEQQVSPCDIGDTSFIRHIYLNVHIDDDNLDHFVQLLQKYETFYPTSIDFYVGMIKSLKKSNVTSIDGHNFADDKYIHAYDTIVKNDSIATLISLCLQYLSLLNSASFESPIHNAKVTSIVANGDTLRHNDDIPRSQWNLIYNAESKNGQCETRPFEKNIGRNELRMAINMDTEEGTNDSDIHFTFRYYGDIYLIYPNSKLYYFNLHNIYPPFNVNITTSTNVKRVYLYEIPFGFNIPIIPETTKKHKLTFIKQLRTDMHIPNMFDCEYFSKLIYDGKVEQAHDLMRMHNDTKFGYMYRLCPNCSDVSQELIHKDKKIFVGDKIDHKLFNISRYRKYVRTYFEQLLKDPIISTMGSTIKHLYDDIIGYSKILGIKTKQKAGAKLKSNIMYDYKIVANATQLIEIEQSIKNTKSSTLMQNVKIFLTSIPESYIGIKYDDNMLTSVKLCFDIELDEDMSIYPWTSLKIKNVVRDFARSFILAIKNKKSLYVTFTTNYFDAIIPLIDYNDVDQIDMFVCLCVCLFTHNAFEILNIYLPILVSIYKSDLSECAKIFVEFMLKNDCYNSPFKYLFLNKLYYAVNGKFNDMLVYNFSKRIAYYPQKYKSLSNSDNIPDHDLSAEIKMFDKWTQMIQKCDYSRLTCQQLQTIIKELPALDNFNPVYVSLEQVLKYSNIIAYMSDEQTYKGLFIARQLDIVDSLDKIEKKCKNDDELIGNIKYFVGGTFDHGSQIMINDYNLSGSMKLFEIITGKIIDVQQFATIQNLIKMDVTSQYNVQELLMGSGKTHVIIPIVLLISYFNGKYQNMINCTATHLISQCVDTIGRFIPFLVNGFCCILDAKREKQQIEYINEIIDSDTNKIIIMDGASIKTYLLGNKEFGQTGSGYIPIGREVLDSQKLYSKMVAEKQSKRKHNAVETNVVVNNTMCNLSMIILDEFDTLITPLKSDLNFPIDTPSNIDHQDVLTMLILSITEIMFTKFRSFMTRDHYDEKLNKLIIKKIMLEMHSSNYASLNELMKKLYKGAIKQIKKTQHINQFFQLTPQEQQTVRLQQKGGIDPPDNILLYFVRETYTQFYKMLALLQDKDYGWDENSNNPYIAIPYYAQDTPLHGSQFTDIFINIILTSFTYCSKDFREKDAIMYIEYIKMMYNKYGHSIDNYFKIDKELITASIYENTTGFINRMTQLRKTKYAEYINTICIYLQNIVIPTFITINKTLLNCSFIDIIDPNFIKTKYALSGTTNVHLPTFVRDNAMPLKNVISGVVSDKIGRSKISLALKGANMKRMTAKVVTLSNDDFDAIMTVMIDYDVLIDAGSFLRYYTNEQVANKLSRQFTNHYIVYFANDNLPNIMQNGNYVEYNLRNLKHEHNYKIYFDEKHTIGTDIDIPSTANGIVTVNKLNTKTKISQAIFRLREINYRQCCDYLLKGDNILQLDELLKILDKNETDYFVGSTEKFSQQYILCLLRMLFNYDPNAYKMEQFVPNFVTDKIFESYSTNFAKEHFLNFVHNKIGQHYKQIYGNFEPFQKKILGIIKKYNKLIRSSTAQFTIANTQQQHAKHIQYNINISYELNSKIDRNHHNYDIRLLKNIKYINFYNIILQNKQSDQRFIDIMNFENEFYLTKYPNSKIHSIPFLDFLYTKVFDISPNAVSILFGKLLDKFGRDKELYFYLANKDDNHVILSTLDMQVLRVQNSQYIEEQHIELIDKFNGNVYNDLAMMMCLQIPHEHEVENFHKNSFIIDNKKSIKEYFKYFHKYKLSSVSPVFATFLDS